MADALNLSPLAFELLKYLCNSNTGDAYQVMDKDTLGIGTQEDFLKALDELRGQNLVLLSRDATYVPDTNIEDYTAKAMQEINSTHNMDTISAKINPAAGNVCGNMDYYIGAERGNGGQL